MRRGAGIHHCQNRWLGFERLEDRHLLATITVNTLIDVDNAGDSLTTLREAISTAAPGDMIDFSVTGTINLTSTGSGHLTIDKNLTIQGPGADVLTIKAYDPDADGTKDSDGRRVFLVSDGDPNNLIDVTISGLTVTGGDPELDPGAIAQEHTTGGGIRSHENLTLIEVVVTDSFTLNGGGIGNSRQPGFTGPFNGTLTVIDSVISGNSANDGGAMFTQRGNVMVIRTTMEDNFASNAGGAVFNQNGDVTLRDSLISGNESLNPAKDYSGKGGGVASFYGGDMTIEGTTISGNTSAYLGGGIFFNNTGTLTVKNSTISGNSADEKGGGVYVFYYANNAITIAHSTITGNSAGTSGGGIGNGSSDVNVYLDHSIVAGNLRGTARDDLDGSFDARFSLVGDRRSASVNNLGGSLIGTSLSPIDAMLSPLADNGGPTPTHMPLTGSQAINGGYAEAMAGTDDVPLYDQRGNPHGRVLGGQLDIGAVEVEPSLGPDLPGDYNLNGVVDAADYVLWRKTQNSTVPPYSGADGNGDTVVNDEDYDLWSGKFGDTSPPALPGDYNLNGVVDAADYVLWRKTQNSTVPPYSGADGNGDTVVNDEDYDLWSGKFGDTSPPGAGAAVDAEPALASYDASEFTTSSPESATDHALADATWLNESSGIRFAPAAHAARSETARQSAQTHEALLAVESLYGPVVAMVREEPIGSHTTSSTIEDASIVDELFDDYRHELAVSWPSVRSASVTPSVRST